MALSHGHGRWVKKHIWQLKKNKAKGTALTETATLAYKACIDVAFDKHRKARLSISYTQSLQIISI